MDHPSPTGSLEQGETFTRPSRVVVIQGQSFSVQEEPCNRGGVMEPTLVFSSDRVARRVRIYPADWHALPDDALIQLSWER
jgi:hypothetical protein